MKVLVIDDSKTMRIILRNALKEFGHEVVEAGDGKEGLTQAQAHTDMRAVFVDWNMPEMNGLEIVKAARGVDGTKTVPIVMVTTENEMANIKSAMDAGANEFLIKPFTKESVHDKLALLGLG